MRENAYKSVKDAFSQPQNARSLLHRAPLCGVSREHSSGRTTRRGGITCIGSPRHKRIEKRAAALFAEEMTLTELRRARKITQVRAAKALGIRQEGASRLERRSDLLLSTLRNAVKPMGRDLRLVAEFPNRKPVVLKGMTEAEAKPAPTGRKPPHPRPKTSVPRR